jgi:hypothetical protein
MVAAGWPPAVLRYVGSTVSCDGAGLIEHIVLAMFTTWSGI